MDPFTALSVAVSVVQCVDWSRQIVCKAKELHRAGASQENSSTETVTYRLKELTDDIKTRQISTRSRSQNLNLDRICDDCIMVSNELLRRLQQLKVPKDGVERRRWKSFRQALKTVWSKKDIDAMATRFSSLRGELMTEIIVITSHDLAQLSLDETNRAHRLDEHMQQIITAVSDQQDERSIRSIVNNIAVHQRAELQRLAAAVIQQDRKFQSLEVKSQAILSSLLSMNASKAAHIDKQFEYVDSDLNTSNEVIPPSLRSSRADFIYEDTKLKLSRVSLCILDGLRFDLIEMRHSSIAREHAQTCSWVLTGSSQTASWSPFSEWLTDGVGIYWVSGKAGSGKSTVMKFIWNHPRTTQLLTQWAGDGNLLCAAFFFWNSGEKIQSSQEGLFRTLLYQLCRRRPDLLPRAFPDEWDTLSEKVSCDLEIKSAQQKSVAELRDAFERVVACACPSLRICIFIDGFDEAEGDVNEITDFMINVVKSSKHFKLCLSSRPWPIFESSFSGYPSLKMQDLSSDDIKRFTHDKLYGDASVRNLLGTDPRQAEWLIEEVVKRACGVFLWVRLVVGQLIQGIRDGDDAVALYDRLRSLPSGLEDLFDRILGQIDSIHQAEASQIFQIFRANGNKLDVLTMNRALKYARPTAFSDALKMGLTPLTKVITVQSHTLLERVVDRGVRRLNSRCRGLLEISEAAHEDPIEMSIEDIEELENLPQTHVKSREASFSSGRPPPVHQVPCVAPEESDDECYDDDFEWGDDQSSESTEWKTPRSMAIPHSIQHQSERVWLEPWARKKIRLRSGPIVAEPLARPRFRLTSPRGALQVHIRYIHRTARDYLEQPGIWNRVLGMSASFDPTTALLAAGVEAIKVSHQELEPYALPSITPQSFAAHLQDLNLIPSMDHVSLIDDIDKAFAAREMEESIQGMDLPALEDFKETWETPGLPLKSKGVTSWHGHELVIAIRKALPWYAELKISNKDDGSAICFTDNQGLPLAFSAITQSIGIPAFLALCLSWDEWTGWLSVRSGSHSSYAAAPWPGFISLLRAVVSTPGHGPDHYKFRGHTLWEYVITLVHNMSDIYGPNEIFEPWCHIFEIMLDSDADPYASCIHNTQDFVNAISMSKNWEAPMEVAHHMTPPRESPTPVCDEEQGNFETQVESHHSVETVIRDVFLRHKRPGAERLLDLLHEKQRIRGNLNTVNDANHKGERWLSFSFLRQGLSGLLFKLNASLTENGFVSGASGAPS